MSLIRVRRKRKQEWIDTRKGLPARALMVLLGLVLLLMWYIGNRF
jgi:hypothetical protein